MVAFSPFEVELWMDKYEVTAKYNIAETCCDSISIKELLEHAGMTPEEFVNEKGGVFERRMTYGDIPGPSELRANIASLFNAEAGIKGENIVVTQGAIAANFLTLLSLCKPGDHVVCVDPTYQQLIETPASFGATVSKWTLKSEEDWLPNVSDLKKLLTLKTNLVIINNPNNPTGRFIPTKTLLEIVEAIKAHAAPGCVLFSDEVYRPIFHHQDEELPVSVLELGYPHAVVSGSLSKAYSLAGLRIGWLASNDESIVKAAILRRDYNIISCSQISSRLASIALNPTVRPKIVRRNLELVNTNRLILEEWVARQEGRVTWVVPNAGTTALLNLGEGSGKDGDDVKFSEELFEKTGVMVVPAGLCFGVRNHLRIGYVSSTETLTEGLELLGPFLENWQRKRVEEK
ncbi:aminotransferase function [Mrakia frigida]|uniref:aminotransferase function n=1 Tax=Mrakia frigida TaxID=29902 RepID=UPI003FCC1E65